MYQPPTDNLYKFMALTGLVILGFSIYYPLSLRIKITDQITELEQASEVATININFISSNIHTINEIASNEIAKTKGLYTPPTDKASLSYTESEVKEMLHAADEGVRDIQIEQAAIQYRLKSTRFLVSQLRLLNILVCIMNFAGCFLMVYGFRLWYKKTQFHLDRIIALQNDSFIDKE